MKEQSVEEAEGDLCFLPPLLWGDGQKEMLTSPFGELRQMHGGPTHTLLQKEGRP